MSDLGARKGSIELMEQREGGNELDEQPAGEPADFGPKWQGRVVYRIEESSSGDGCQAVCPELIVTAFGGSPGAAREALRSQVGMYLEDCDEMGLLDEVLIEAGFYFDGDSWISNEVTPVKDPNIVIL